MALFKHMSREERQEEGYQFLVLLFLVPVWIQLEYDEETELYAAVFGKDGALLPKMREPNWVPRPLLWLACMMLGAWMFATEAIFGKAGMPIVNVMADMELLDEG